MKKILTKKGFTLIELIVVIAILAILAAILIPSLTNYLARATYARNQSNARSFYTAVVLQVATTNPPAFVLANVPGTNPCGSGPSVTVLNGAVTAFTCTINNLDFSLANNFSPAFTP